MNRPPMANAIATGIVLGIFSLKTKPMSIAIMRLATNKQIAIETVNGRFGCDESDTVALGGA